MFNYFFNAWRRSMTKTLLFVNIKRLKKATLNPLQTCVFIFCLQDKTKSRLILLDWVVNSEGPVYGDKALFSRRSLPAAVRVQ